MASFCVMDQAQKKKTDGKQSVDPTSEPVLLPFFTNGTFSKLHITQPSFVAQQTKCENSVFRPENKYAKYQMLNSR
jgi:hypothetical protein